MNPFAVELIGVCESVGAALIGAVALRGRSLRARRQRLAEARRRRLVAWISHDLRGPLVRLRAMTEAIEDGVVADLPGYCRKIRTDTDRLTELVDDLFEISRLDAGTLRLKPRKVALADLVSDVIAGLDVLANERGIRLCAATIDPAVGSVDDRAMTRVFNNLLVNAVQYSRPGGTVTVHIRETGGWAEVAVVDECGGIPPDQLGSVFDMGWRGNAEPDRGGGLGLSIVEGIVHAHGGRVSVRNVPGGCCFEVRLPMMERETSLHNS